ncbi:M14 family zinc carboxypeptidase [Lysobacter sp. N42]|uniref:M14 family zinc carboxypeptidase n=1 Tax=Lysobacter sp. N42 TaxID=2545719 RepID=UPI001049D0AC|nr:M14 family zinc carboxypeptidase [Lysobacter sp. N42]TCZ88680.1 peptidase M14 [Lysobacter sp. N42]
MRTTLLAALLALAPAALAQSPLATVAERSGFSRTGRYEEVIALCEAFARAHADRVRCESFGTTPEGRPMKLLVATATGAFTPEAARERGIPVTLMQGGIHAGEIDGKDAGFLALRELLEDGAARGALARQVFVFVPVFNVDGHERFRAWNRPNQRGPEEMGFRVTAQNLNLNRDYMKADAPEMRAMLALLQRWDPLVYVDLHVTDGAKFEHDVSIQVEPVNGGDEPLRAAGLALRSGTIERLAKHGSLPLPFYPSFVVNDDPASGFVDGVATPRFSHGYAMLRNRLGMLVETHSWRPYPHRVRVTRNTILAVLEQVARDGRRWQALAAAADARARALGGTQVALDYQATEAVRSIRFRGYAYTRAPSEVSGALMTRYDETRPQVWTVPLRDVIVPRTLVTAPRAGYVVPAAWAERVAAKLDAHGVRYERLATPVADVDAEAWRARTMRFTGESFEGRQRLTLDGAWTRERHSLGAGALYVPIAQDLSRVAIGLLEPNAPDALAGWGLFNAAFERKEYMEDYVAEEEAEKMLVADPALRAEFERRLREDAAFAKDPQARLEFFYRRHAAWDERYGLYPVLRVDRDPR